MARRLKRPGAPGPGPRALLVLAAGVLFVHAFTVDHIARTVQAWAGDVDGPSRLQVAYVRELMPTETAPVPPARAVEPAVPRPRPEHAPTRAVETEPAPGAAEPAASAPVPEDSTPPPVTASLAPLAPPTAESAPPAGDPPAPVVAASAQPPADVASAATTLADGLPDAPPFEWPASTRLSYRLTGQYRGDVHGQAQVEWIRALPRYQVHMDVTVGLPIAPLYTRRMRSDGRLGPAGLQPERYDEVSQLAFRDRRALSVVLADDGVTLADGRRWTPPAAPSPTDGGTAVQDSASQFVQLSYLFTVQPQRLVVGATIAFPLALPRRVEPWVYEVVGEETVNTAFGALEAFHVRPRRGTPRGNDLLAEAWFSPRLAYLPVRIRIQQDDETFLDLVLERRPELAAR